MTPELLAEKVTDLFSLPDIVLQLNELMQDEKTTNADLEEVMALDPSMATKLLKIVNSAYFGFPGKIDSLARAISMIGRQELRSLVMAAAATDSFTGIPEHLVDMDVFWYHSITSGVLARLLAGHCKRLDRERFFLAGLLHGIGKLMLFAEYPQQSSLILSLKDQGVMVMTAKEKETFGFTYVEAGAALLKKWKLPQTIWLMIQHQQDPLAAPEFVDDASILHVAVAVADRIEPCAKVDIGFPEPELDYNDPAFEYLQLKEADVSPLIQEAGLQVFDLLGFIRPGATVIF
jgi:HD-like signal output (HDOD) protein